MYSVTAWKWPHDSPHSLRLSVGRLFLFQEKQEIGVRLREQSGFLGTRQQSTSCRRRRWTGVYSELWDCCVKWYGRGRQNNKRCGLGCQSPGRVWSCYQCSHCFSRCWTQRLPAPNKNRTSLGGKFTPISLHCHSGNKLIPVHSSLNFFHIVYALRE